MAHTQGLITQSAQNYYDGNDFGGYQFVALKDVISSFMIAYVGENKIISKVKRADVVFHAKRALQELSYDTLKSCKSQEVEICPNLKMPLPQDYVNYVKLTWSDSSGIEHIIYPTSKTSHPFAIEQVQADCTNCGDTSETYQYGETVNGVLNPNVLTPQESDCGTADITCTFSTTGLDSVNHLGAYNVGQYLDTTSLSDPDKQLYWEIWFSNIDIYCNCLQNSNSTDNCGDFLGWDDFDGVNPHYNNLVLEMRDRSGWSSLRNDSNPNLGRTRAMNGTWLPFTNTITLSTPTSNTWDSYKSATSSENQDDYQDDTWWSNMGERYGLDPQYAQSNGSFFIDCARGVIHFSSNLSGKTIILKYISDNLGTDDEMVVPKLAEEAMYKHIAYAMLSSRSNIPEYIVRRFKKEKFAETRKAKIRLSNIKLEEISQIIRGKSKQIKH